MLSGRSGHRALATAPGCAGEPRKVYPAVTSFALSIGEGSSGGPRRAYPLPALDKWMSFGDLDPTSSYLVQSKECLPEEATK